jgi:hypothetical protein
LAVADTPFGVFASAKVHRIELFTFNDGIRCGGLK